MEIRKHLNISDNDVVVEIGSGSEPYHRSNILIDKYYEDSEGFRNNYALKQDDRIIIIADAEKKIPLKSQSSDYTICNHVFEHLTDPLKMKKELERVSQKGFIGVPSEVYDKLYDPPTHFWYVNLIEDALIFTKKEKEINYIENYMGESIKALYRVDNKNNSIRLMFEQFRDVFFIEYEWDKEIKIKFSDSVISSLTRDKLVQNYRSRTNYNIMSIYKNRVMRKIDSLLKKKYLIANSNMDFLENNLICVNCDSKMRKESNKFICKECKNEYKFEDNVIYVN